jgi:hypothetical protein
MIRSIVLAGALGALALAAAPARPQEHVTPEEARALAAEGFVFGFPLVLMDATARRMEVGPNQFQHRTAFPDASFTDVVSPNADTLYSSAWLDLSQEPVVLSVPDTDGRYYLMPMLDAWTNVFASPGKRTTGTRKAEFAVCGPDWKGSLPGTVHEIRAPTNLVWIIGRTQTNGPADYANVHAVQAGYRLAPLSRWGKSAKAPPIEAAAHQGMTPLEEVASLHGAAFFARLAALMKANPPSAADGAIIGRLAKLGVSPGQPFEPPARLVEAIDAGALEALEGLRSAAQERVSAGGTWWVDPDLGTYGTDYGRRAKVAMFGLGANLPEDALYPNARTDADGQPFDGSHVYVMHFEPGQMPPVHAFWSLTLYDERQRFADNPLGRYALGDRDRLELRQDGSLDIYIQHASPGASKESNWLPAPEGPFNLVLRMYWPKDEALQNRYQIPPVKRVE